VPSESLPPSEVEFASFLVYNPRPTHFSSEVSALSRRVRDAVKKETAQWARTQRLGERMRAEIGNEVRERFLPANATLVPMPGHAPMKDPKSHWPARELCEAFVTAGLGARWLALLSREVAVSKAAFSAASERPSATAHYDSMRAITDLTAGRVITVVDDVVTRGATMFAAVTRLREVMPHATVRGFALIRTMSSDAITSVKEPCSGIIRLVSWGTQREP
jgi:phosphoribosylpyrophosphate synthetase